MDMSARTRCVTSKGMSVVLEARSGLEKREAPASGSQYMLNSAHGVMLPIREPWPAMWPRGAAVKLPPTAPPMMLSPLMWEASSGNVAKSRAMLVRAPVATSQAVFLGWAMRAVRVARRALMSVIGGEVGEGSRSVPSRPEVPGYSKSTCVPYLKEM